MFSLLPLLRIAAVAFTGLASFAPAQTLPPATIQYQGRVSVSGVPFNPPVTGNPPVPGNGYFKFVIFDEGENRVWWSSWDDAGSIGASVTTYEPTGNATVSVSNGLFSAELGSGSMPGITSAVFFDGSGNVRSQMNLRVWFSASSADGSFVKLSPDRRLSSVPFALVAGTVAKGAITSEKLAVPVQQSLIPAGTILPYSGVTAPSGFLLCNGQSYPKSEFPALVAVLATGLSPGAQAVFGGSGSDFNVPDLGGKFLRAVDYKNSVDPNRNQRTAMQSGGNTGNAVGTLEGDAFQGHHHQLRTIGGNYLFPQTLRGASGASITFMDHNPDPAFDRSRAAGILSDGVNGVPRTAEETRPVNVSVNYIIKY